MKAYMPLMAIFCAVVAVGQQRMLTYDECVAMALDANVSVKTARNNVAGAGLQQREAFVEYLPGVSVSATGMLAADHLVEMQMQFPPELQLPARSIELAKSGIAANATAMLPLYAGGLIRNGNKLAKVGTEVEQLRLMQSENEVRLTVAQYYWQIAAIKDKIKTVDAINAQLDVIYADAQAALSAGVTTRNDVLQVDLKKNEMESTAIELNNNADVLKMLLAQYIGLDDDCQFDIAVPGELAEVGSPDELRVMPESALGLTPEYRLLDKKIEAAKIQRRMTLGESLPKVGIGGGYFYNNLLNKSKNSWIGMLTISVPISWKTGYSMRRAKIAIENARMERDDSSERLAIGMRKAYNDLYVAFQNISIARKSIEQASENLRMHEDFYQAGTSTMSDLLDAQTLYMKSCDRFSEAVAAYETCKVTYLVKTGR